MDAGAQHLFSAASPVRCALLRCRARAAPVLLQQPGRRLPALRRTGRGHLFDPKRVVVSPQLSLASGAIRGWDRRNQFYFQMLQPAARSTVRHRDAFEKLPENVREVVPMARADENRPFRYMADNGRMVLKEHPFEGIIPNLERRLRDRRTRWRCARNCRSTAPPSPAPAMPRQPSAQRGAPSCWSAARAARGWPNAARRVPRLLRHLQLAGGVPRWPSASCARSPTAWLPDRRRPRLPFARPLGGDPLGRRGAAHPPGDGQIGSGLTGVMYVLDEPSIGLHQRDNDRLLARCATCATSATR